MWQILKERFQHGSHMSISKKVLEAISIKLSNCTNIHEYTSTYQEASGDVCSLTTEDSELTTKGASMILQAVFLTNMGYEYKGIVSTIESEWTNGTTNLDSTIFRLVKFEEIRKESSKAKGQPIQPTILLSSSGSTNPDNPRAPKGTCTNLDYVKRGITSHFIENCFLKHPELRPQCLKYSLRQMRPKGSKTNL